MAERKHNLARLGWACAAIIVIVILGLVVARLLQPPPTETPTAAPIPQPPVEQPEKTAKLVSAPLPPLGRPQFLAVAAAAADAVASGRPLPVENAALTGRSFAIRLPFGCSGPDMESEWAGWRYNPRTKALKLWAKPDIGDDATWVREVAGAMAFEAVEGFWIRRPWTSAEACPPGAGEAPADGESPAPERQTLGIAQFFAPGAPRTLRRDSRPYAVTLKADDAVTDVPREYRLVLNGRVVGFADGQPVHCRNEAAGLRPVCLISVEFSHVAFEDAVNDRTLSEWRN